MPRQLSFSIPRADNMSLPGTSPMDMHDGRVPCSHRNRKYKNHALPPSTGTCLMRARPLFWSSIIWMIDAASPGLSWLYWCRVISRNSILVRGFKRCIAIEDKGIVVQSPCFCASQTPPDPITACRWLKPQMLSTTRAKRRPLHGITVKSADTSAVTTTCLHVHSHRCHCYLEHIDSMAPYCASPYQLCNVILQK